MMEPVKTGRNAETTVLRRSALFAAEAEEKKDEFRAAMRLNAGVVEAGSGRMEVGRGMRDKDEKSKTEKGAEPLPPPFSGDALLRNLGDAYAPLDTQDTASRPVRDALTPATELAERILVNADNRAVDGEVRITLKEVVLPDTEIILRKEGDLLLVQLASGNPASLDALRQAREDLREKLLALNRKITVEVLDSRTREDGGDSGHAGGRSRGLEYLTDSED